MRLNYWRSFLATSKDYSPLQRQPAHARRAQVCVSRLLDFPPRGCGTEFGEGPPAGATLSFAVWHQPYHLQKLGTSGFFKLPTKVQSLAGAVGNELKCGPRCADVMVQMRSASTSAYGAWIGDVSWMHTRVPCDGVTISVYVRFGYDLACLYSLVSIP